VPSGSRCHAQPLDDGKRLVAFQPANYPAQRRGKPANVLMEWQILFPRRCRARHCVKISSHTP
jgi:hypothetical protein